MQFRAGLQARLKPQVITHQIEAPGPCYINVRPECRPTVGGGDNTKDQSHKTVNLFPVKLLAKQEEIFMYLPPHQTDEALRFLKFLAKCSHQRKEIHFN